MSESNMLALTDDTFVDTVASDKPTLVLFSASWSGHSQAMHPVISSIALQFANELQVGTAHATENVDTIARFGIRTVPTLALFRGSKLLGVRLGRQSREDVSAFVEEIL